MMPLTPLNAIAVHLELQAIRLRSVRAAGRAVRVIEDGTALRRR